MAKAPAAQLTVSRTESGLSIAGTRVSLYEVMDYVIAGWPAKLIRDRLNLTDRQVVDALEYIDAHRSEVQAEYRQVVQLAAEVRQYWEERNRERLAEIAAAPPPPGQEELRRKLEEWKSRLQSPR